MSGACYGKTWRLWHLLLPAKSQNPFGKCLCGDRPEPIIQPGVDSLVKQLKPQSKILQWSITIWREANGSVTHLGMYDDSGLSTPDWWIDLNDQNMVLPWLCVEHFRNKRRVMARNKAQAAGLLELAILNLDVRKVDDAMPFWQSSQSIPRRCYAYSGCRRLPNEGKKELALKYMESNFINRQSEYAKRIWKSWWKVRSSDRTSPELAALVTLSKVEREWD